VSGLDIHRVFSPKALDGEVAVVTGGGSGIGLAIARDLTACGAEVTITSRSAQRLDGAQVTIAEQTGELCGTMPCDVRKEADVERLRDYVLNRSGPATIVVNNAAANFHARAERMSRRAFDTVLETDLFGTFNVTRAFVPDMISRRHGVVVNVTLAVPERGFPGFSHCGAAKAGIVSLTASWAYEWGRYGVRVNALGPGPIPTDGVAANMLDTDSSDAFSSIVDKVPLRRLGTPYDISPTVVFLCSPAGSWITGGNIVVDGGLSLNPSPKPGF
jgi:NAD(P)-dependent dehydrogenase (short-subunit alcohol dehydrogenase family)